MTTLDVLEGCALCDTDGAVEFSKTDKNDTWEIVKLSE